jgi:23S rRNA pseudouridine1911/1915/1917 synthase
MNTVKILNDAILYEDNHIIAVNKEVGDIVQPDNTGDISLEEKVKEYIKHKYNKPGNVFLEAVHRLDRPVSGVVLFGRTSKALARLNELFRDKQMKKTYWAIVKNSPPAKEGTLVHFLVRNEKQNKSYAHPAMVNGAKQATLHYRVLANSDTYRLLEIDLETGRHHQIRCQLATIGCPVRGDLKYGFDRSLKGGGISLHARSIEFIHPVKDEKIYILANPPRESLWDVFMKCL